jgi:hypothetical protein
MRTSELILVAQEVRQLLALGERRQRACVKRANPVSFERKRRVCRAVLVLGPAGPSTNTGHTTAREL